MSSKQVTYSSYGVSPYVPMDNDDAYKHGYGQRVGSCCGSNLVQDVTRDEFNIGITFSVDDNPVEEIEGVNYHYETIAVGNVFFNFKLRHK